jgi:hypothetical protein
MVEQPHIGRDSRGFGELTVFFQIQ